MDIPAFLITYGGPGGLALVSLYWAISDRKFSAERRAELREDIDREQKDNTELRATLADERTKNARLEAENDSLHAEVAGLRRILEQGGAP